MTERVRREEKVRKAVQELRAARDAMGVGEEEKGSGVEKDGRKDSLMGADAVGARYVPS